MKIEILNTIYNVVIDNASIRELSHNSKIANIAYEDMIVCYLEIVYKFDGIDFLKEKVATENNPHVNIFFATMMLSADKEFAKNILRKLIPCDIERISEGARNLLNEKYSSLEETAQAYGNLQNKIQRKKKMKLKLPF
ncbi:MAG: hypothetical protein EA362_08715 [Saprospirales bacterium]|nr:MAG: hypothetical protein EA362_08715 [Saprospirales bacterium]